MVRVGVVGCAAFARRRMLPAMAAHPDIELVAVASRDAAKAVEVAGEYGCRPVTGYRELIEDAAVDAVYVPLPAAMHAEWVEAALTAGKHVLAEKPVTTDAARTRELFALARSRDLTLMENVMFLQHAQHTEVRKMLADGVIGELRAFHAAFAIPGLPDSDIRYRPELGGGSLFDIGIYPIRAAVHFLGCDLRIRGAVLTRSPGREVDTSGAVLLSAPGGVSAQLTFGMEHAYRSMYQLWGSTGRITVERAFTPPADFAPDVRVESASGTETVSLAPDDQVANTLTAFVGAIRAGGAPPGDCLAQADLLDAVRRLAVS